MKTILKSRDEMLLCYKSTNQMQLESRRQILFTALSRTSLNVFWEMEEIMKLQKSLQLMRYLLRGPNCHNLIFVRTSGNILKMLSSSPKNLTLSSLICSTNSTCLNLNLLCWRKETGNNLDSILSSSFQVLKDTSETWV